MSRGNLGLWMCAGVLLGVTAHADAQDAATCESDDACAQGTFCSGEGSDAGGSNDGDGDDGDGDDGDGGGTDRDSNASDAPDAPAIIPGQCIPLLTGFCEDGAGCADGLTCTSGSSYPDGCDEVGGDDGDSDTSEPSDPVAGCEPVEDRFGSCQLPEVECASDDDCGAGLRCVVTGGSGGCDDEGCEFVEYKSCVYEAKRCDDAPCSAGYDCVAQAVDGGCTGGDGGCDETGCWTEEPDCEPDTIEKVCLIAYRGCDEAACAEGEECLAFSALNGDLSVPEHWGVEGPVKSCVPVDSVLVAQTAGGLPEAPRNVSDAPGWGDGGDDSDGDIEDEGTIDEDPSTEDNGEVGGDDGGDGASDDGPSSPSDDEPTSSDEDPSADPGDSSPDESDDDEPKGSSCSVGFAGNDVSSLASIMLALGLTVRRRRRR